MLDARLTYDLAFGKNGEYVTVDGISELNAKEVMAKLTNVDFIMVRDGLLDGAANYEQIHAQLHNDDVDFYSDNSAMYGIQQIAGIGQLSSDLYGEGYDVMTSAVLETFGDMSDMRIFYDGKHSDFVDTYDRLLSTSEGTFNMALDVTGVDANVNKYGIGSNWEAEVAASNPGGTASSFYIDVNGKKVAVTFDGSGWKVDNTSLFIAQNAQANLVLPDVTTFSQVVSDRYDINYTSDGQFTNSIYLNATEQQIGEVLASTDGSIDSVKAFNFGFYTKFNLNSNLVNIKIENVVETAYSLTDELGADLAAGNYVFRGNETDGFTVHEVTGTGPYVVDSTAITTTAALDTAISALTQSDIDGYTFLANITNPSKFKVDPNDIDVLVEDFYNVVDINGASVNSGSEAANFVKVDDNLDIALGNGGDDTYVIKSSTKGSAIEYGDIKSSGGLANSESDSVNFKGITDIDDLNFVRKQVRNEQQDNTLSITEKGGSTSTDLFDNFNIHLDFRRIEYLTIDDGANNNEIFEISVDGNTGTDGTGKDLSWDNEIVVASSTGSTISADGGIDVLVGGAGNDTIDLSGVLDGSEVHLKSIDTVNDTIVKVAGTRTDTENDGKLTVDLGNSETMTIYHEEADDDIMAQLLIDTATS